MDPTSTFATALATKSGDAAIDVAKKEAEGFLKKLFGPSVEAIGENLALRYRERLFNNVVDVVGRAKKKLDAVGVSPQEVPPKIIHPLLEAAALEEEVDLQELFGNLLANSADPRGIRPVNVFFPTMLRDLSSRDAKFLDALYVHAHRDPNSPERLSERKMGERSLQMIYARAGLSRHPKLGVLSHGDWENGTHEIRADLREFGISLTNLKRLGILDAHEIVQRMASADFFKGLMGGPSDVDIRTDTMYSFTELGICFLAACRPPEP